MVNKKKNTDHIRIRKGDKLAWKEYCKALGTSSPDLFSKVMQSEKLRLNDKIMEEMRKRDAEMKRKLGLFRGKK